MRGWWMPVLVVVGACGPKAPPEPAAPRVGWIQEEGWAGECWFPPNYEEIAGGARRIKRSEGITALMAQWRGERSASVQFDTDVVHAIETTLLGHPDRVEWIAAENAAQCEEAMRRGGRLDDWTTWIESVNGRAREGLCPYRPLDYTLFDYLSIESGWQISRRVCKDDEFDVIASSTDFYKISDDGDWISAEGDTTQSALGTDLPCNLEGCYRGQVIMRYTGDDGHIVVIPVGHGARFTAPNHGTIEVRINDDSLNDNTWKVESGLQHHTSIEYDGEN